MPAKLRLRCCAWSVLHTVPPAALPSITMSRFLIAAIAILACTAVAVNAQVSAEGTVGQARRRRRTPTHDVTGNCLLRIADATSCSHVIPDCVTLCFDHAQGTGTWGVYADGGCGISLFSSTFVSGQCSSQASGSSTVYFIVSHNVQPRDQGLDGEGGESNATIEWMRMIAGHRQIIGQARRWATRQLTRIGCVSSSSSCHVFLLP